MNQKIKKIINLITGIYAYNVHWRFNTVNPTALQINVTYKCNSRCQMCRIWQMRPKNEVTFDEWRGIMKDEIFRTIRNLIVAGGEPILHPEILKLIQLFISSMPHLESLTLVTNGLLKEKTISVVTKMASMLGKKNINFSVSISMDGIGKTNDEIRGVKNAFKMTSGTIFELKKLQKKNKFWLGVGAVVCRKNLYETGKIKEWCRRNKIPLNFQLVGFHKSYVQNINQKNELDFSEKDKQPLFSLLKKLTQEKSIRDLRFYLRAYYWQDMLNMYQGATRTTPCPFIFDAFALGSLGDVYYCLSEKQIGNVRQGRSVSEIYYDPNNLIYRKKMSMTVCLHCNSGCMISSALGKDFKRFAWFLLTGNCWPFYK